MDHLNLLCGYRAQLTISDTRTILQHIRRCHFEPDIRVRRMTSAVFARIRNRAASSHRVWCTVDSFSRKSDQTSASGYSGTGQVL